MNYYIGIDPGKHGAIAILNEDGSLWRLIDMPNNIGKEVYDFLYDSIEFAEGAAIVAFIEQAQAMPKQGIKGAFVYGKGYGEIIAVLKILKIAFQEIHSLSWKREFKLLKKDKIDSVKVAEQLFPDVYVSFRSDRGRLLDGRAEAMLIAEYCRRRWR